MNRKLIYIIISIVLILAIISGYLIYSSNKKDTNYETEKLATEEEILDDCTDEYEYFQKEQLEQANSTEEKISPNAKMTLNKIYSSCGHTISEQIELPEELVNMTKDQLANEYSDWNIDGFSENEIVLSKKFEGQCGEHYLLRDNDGIIAIYKINENNEEELLDETEISTEYLTETDLIEIQKGLRVNGLEELNKILEDYE